VTVQAVPRFNPFSAGFRRDPYPLYRALRETRPVHKTMGMWVLTRYADVQAVLLNRAFSAGLIPELVSRQAGRGPAPDPGQLRQIARLGAKSLVFTDNPDHARLRRLVNRVFTAESVAGLRPRVERAADRLLRPALDRSGLDVIADLAEPLPVAVMCDWLALPPELGQRAGAWVRDIRFLLEPGLLSGADLARAGGVVAAFTAALARLVRERRARPGPDLVSQLAGAVTGGGDRLDDEEAAFVCIMCFVAGNETTKSLIGNALLALLRHPEQGARLRCDPGRLGPAVDEALRYDSPLQLTKRIATSDVEIGGQLVRAGDQVLLCLGAANRDPEAFSRPDDFDISRDIGRDIAGPVSGHLAFGHGMHGCLGGSLARLQAAVALDRLYRAASHPELAVPEARLDWQDRSVIVRCLTSLPVTTRPDRAGSPPSRTASSATASPPRC
jgi:cytochrome P450